MSQQSLTDLARDLRPFIGRWIDSAIAGVNASIVTSAGTVGGAISDAQAPQFLKTDGSRALTGNLSVSAGVTIDGVDLSVFKTGYDTFKLLVDGIHAGVQFLTLASSGDLGAERVLAPGDGLTGSDAAGTYTLAVGAGAGLTAAADSIAVGAGAGITVNADDVALTTPGTLTGATSNASAGSHTHAITTGAPGADSVNLAASSAGVGAPLARADHTHQLDEAIAPTWTGAHLFSGNRVTISVATEQLRLEYNASIYVSHTVSSNGVYTIGVTGGASDTLVLAPDGNIVLNPNSGATIGDVLPNANYRVNLGSPTRQWLSIHAAELWIQTLVAEDVVSTVGGRIWVTPTTTLTRDLASGDTTIYVKDNQMQSGDIVLMKRANLTSYGAGTPLAQTEYLQIDSAYTTVTGTPPNTEFSYTVIRGLNPTGGKQWYAGDALANTGTTGSGFHEIYSGESILSVPFDVILNEKSGVYSANYAGFKEWTPFASTAAIVDDAVYFGVVGAAFNSVYYYLSRAMSLTGTILLEYWNSVTTTWTSLGDVTAQFTSTGFKQLGFTTASAADWGTRSVNGITAYWVRARVSAISAFGQHPLVSGRRAYHEKNQWGPTWVVWHRNSTTYNDFTERLAAGQLRGLYDYSTSTYGFVAGRYAATYPWVALDDTNGLRIMRHNTQMAQWDTSGNILVGQVAASQSNVLITSGAIKIRINTTDKIAMTNAGVITVGEVGSGLPNVHITSTTVALRVNTSNRILLDSNSTITLYDDSGFARVELGVGGTLTLSDAGGVGRVQLTAAGTLSINDDGGNNMIVFDSSGNSYFAGVMTIGTSGEIRQGTGTLGSNFTGLRIWRDTDIGRIGGYNSNTLQWYADTTGRLYAGGGAVLLDAAGVSLRAAAVTVSSQETISWYTSLPTGGTYKGGIYLVTAAITIVPTMVLEVVSGSITMDALSVGMSGDLVVAGGLNVGAVTSAGNGQAFLSSYVYPIGGIRTPVTAVADQGVSTTHNLLMAGEGYFFVTDGSAANYAFGLIEISGTVTFLLSGGTFVNNASAAGKLSLHRDGTGLTINNRTGSSKNIRHMIIGANLA